MVNLRNKVILVTGGNGFLGKKVIDLIKKEKPKKIIIPDSKKDDLRIFKNCLRITKGVDFVIHLAARVGGIGYNMKNPATLFYDNITMGTFIMEAARINKIQKFLAVGTVCAYPKNTSVPFKEKDLWNGYPEETNAPYGLAKKMMLVQSEAYRKQYGFNSVFLLPVNLYGPGDNFNPESSHVIPALIKKFAEAKHKKKPEVKIWGTGRATREFLYVDDAARAIILAFKKYNKSDPVNVGTRFEISISNLAKLIANLIGFTGLITYDKTKPDGQPRRKLSTIRASKEFGFKAKTVFKSGLQKTIDWYIKNL